MLFHYCSPNFFRGVSMIEVSDFFGLTEIQLLQRYMLNACRENFQMVWIYVTSPTLALSPMT